MYLVKSMRSPRRIFKLHKTQKSSTYYIIGDLYDTTHDRDLGWYPASWVVYDSYREIKEHDRYFSSIHDPLRQRNPISDWANRFRFLIRALMKFRKGFGKSDHVRVFLFEIYSLPIASSIVLHKAEPLSFHRK